MRQVGVENPNFIPRHGLRHSSRGIFRFRSPKTTKVKIVFTVLIAERFRSTGKL